MKICVTSGQPDLEADVHERFGRAPYFLFVETETLKFEAIENAMAAATGGVGIQAGQLMAQKGVQAVLTGNVGPNAFETLKAAGIQVVTGVTGKVRDAVGN